MNKKTFLPALTAMLLLAGCSSLQDLTNLENPVYRLLDVRPRVNIALPFSASTIDLDFTIDIDNPNTFGLRLDRMDFDVMLNGRQVVSGITNQDVRIPAQGTGRVDLETRIGYDDLRSIFREVADVIQGGRPDYEIRGTAFYDTPVGRLSFPLTIYRAGR